MKLLITGGAGYIGYHIPLKALDKRYEVAVYNCLSFSRKKDFKLI